MMKKILCMCFVFTFLFQNTVLCFENDLKYDEELTNEEIIETINSNTELQIFSKAALLYDREHDKILYEKNIDERIPNASTTKILTAIVAYENADINDVVEVSQKAATIGGSSINLKKGNKITINDLMKGLLICSGNDAAIAIAEHVGGSVENFCQMMNEKAKKIGAKNTNFVTPHGLDNDEHYTTARDLMLFSNYLLDIEYLAKIVNMREATIKIDDYTRGIHSTNEMLSIYENANGIKTGYTSKAGRCLITSIEEKGRELISIVLGCDTKKQRTRESIMLINYGYKAFEEVDIYEKMVKTHYINVSKAMASSYKITMTGEKVCILPIGEKNKIKYEFKFNKKLVAPIEKNQEIGKIVISVGENEIDTIQIRAPREIKRRGIMDYFVEILEKQSEYIKIRI